MHHQFHGYAKLHPVVQIYPSGPDCFTIRLQLTFGEIDFLPTPFAYMLSVKFIGKYFYFLATVGTVTGEGCEVLKCFKAGAMLRCAHYVLLSLRYLDAIFCH